MLEQSNNQDLQILVQELSKTNPNHSLIKIQTSLLGINYTSDIILLMSEVLVFLSKNETKKTRFKEKSI